MANAPVLFSISNCVSGQTLNLLLDKGFGKMAC